MYYRFDLTAAQWQRIASFFHDRYHHGHRGRPWKDHRTLVNGILWHLYTGAPWPDTPERYGPWQTVYDRFNRWRKDGTWAKILDALLLQLDKAGLIDRDLWCFDGTINRAHTSAAGAKKNPDSLPQLSGPESMQMQEPQDHALGRSRGGFGTKTHLVCDSHGIVLAVWVTAGQRHETQGFEQVMGRAHRPRQAGQPRWPKWGAGDKGYSYPGVRAWLKRRHIEPVIATREDQPRDEDFDKARYRRRNIIERAGGWFKWCRGLAFRFEKLAVNYVALWIIANIQFLLRKYPEALGVHLSETTGGYNVPAMSISLPSRTVDLLPIARNVVGGVGKQGDLGFRAEGLIQMSNGADKYRLYRAVTGTGKKWVVVDDREYCVKELNRETFEAALQDLLS